MTMPIELFATSTAPQRHHHTMPSGMIGVNPRDEKPTSVATNDKTRTHLWAWYLSAIEQNRGFAMSAMNGSSVNSCPIWDMTWLIFFIWYKQLAYLRCRSFSIFFGKQRNEWQSTGKWSKPEQIMYFKCRHSNCMLDINITFFRIQIVGAKYHCFTINLYEQT